MDDREMNERDREKSELSELRGRAKGLISLLSLISRAGIA
jgi:hypothetical protein